MPVARDAVADRTRPAWQVRPFDPSLLPQMADLWVAAWGAAMPEIDFSARRGWIMDRVTKLAAAGATVRVAFDGKTGDLAGFVTFEPDRCWLDQLVVGIAHQGSGAARRLLDEVRGLSGLVRLDVNAENARACAFYVREGFIETGRGVNAASGRATFLMEWRKS